MKFNKKLTNICIIILLAIILFLIILPQTNPNWFKSNLVEGLSTNNNTNASTGPTKEEMEKTKACDNINRITYVAYKKNLETEYSNNYREQLSKNDPEYAATFIRDYGQWKDIVPKETFDSYKNNILTSLACPQAKSEAKPEAKPEDNSGDNSNFF